MTAAAGKGFDGAIHFLVVVGWPTSPAPTLHIDLSGEFLARQAQSKVVKIKNLDFFFYWA